MLNLITVVVLVVLPVYTAGGCPSGKVNNKFEVDEVRYDAEKARTTESRTKLLREQLVNNLYTDYTQTLQLSSSVTFAKDLFFTHRAGKSVEAGTRFKIKLPVVKNGSVTKDVGHRVDVLYGKKNTGKTTETVECECKAPGRSKIQCKALYHEVKTEVPHAIVWRKKDDHSCVRTSFGILKGTLYSEVFLEIKQWDDQNNFVKRTVKTCTLH